MAQSNNDIVDLDLQFNSIENEGASLIARSLGKNSLPILSHTSLSGCGIRDDRFLALVSALERNTLLLQLDLLAFLGLAGSLRVDFSWCTGLSPRGVWPHALAWVPTFSDAIFVLYGGP